MSAFVLSVLDLLTVNLSFLLSFMNKLVLVLELRPLPSDAYHLVHVRNLDRERHRWHIRLVSPGSVTAPIRSLPIVSRPEHLVALGIFSAERAPGLRSVIIVHILGLGSKLPGLLLALNGAKIIELLVVFGLFTSAQMDRYRRA